MARAKLFETELKSLTRNITESCEAEDKRVVCTFKTVEDKEFYAIFKSENDTCSFELFDATYVTTIIEFPLMSLTMNFVNNVILAQAESEYSLYQAVMEFVIWKDCSGYKLTVRVDDSNLPDFN